MKKILHISNYYFPHVGGIETAAQDIVDVLESTHKYQQKVICFGDGPNIVNEVEVIRLPYKLFISSQAVSFRYKHTLKKLIHEFKPDAILIHVPNPLVEHYLNRVHYQGKIVVFHHLDIYRQKILKHFVKPIINKTNKRADVIVCSSEKYIDGSKELIKYKDKCRTIPLCYKDEDLKIDEDGIEKIKRIKEKYKGKTIIFYSGRHAKYKGIRYALKAVRGLKDVVFLIGRVGHKYPSLESKIALTKNAVSLGLLDRERFKIYLHASDIFIFPSLTKNESFGVTLLEAMSLGKPSITFNIPGSGVNFVSLNNVTGIECDNKSVAELRKAIIKLKSNSKLYEEYRQNSIRRAKELFSYKRFSDSIIKLFNEVLNK